MLINSTSHQTGVSTMAHAVAYSYSNWVNRPVLLVSIKSSKYYKRKAEVKPEYDSRFLSIVNGNTGSHGDLKTYTYKINDLLYYFQAHSNPTATKIQQSQELALFLERASREFGVVILDLDHEVNGIKEFLDVADVCLNILTPDKLIVEEAKEKIEQVLNEYREEGGLAVKTKMYYIVNKAMPVCLSNSEVAKILKVESQNVLSVPWDPRIINEGNHNKLTLFLNEAIRFKKGTDSQLLELALNRIYKILIKA